MKIFIDAGHGDHDPGATSKINDKEYIEKDLNLSISKELKNLFELSGHTVFMSREDDSFLTPGARAREANNKNSDLMISIHHNSFTKESANGVEVLHYPGNSDGEKLASCVLKEIVNEFALFDRGTKGRDNLSVLNKTKMTAILVECLFISSPKDVLKIDENYPLKMASCIYNGVAEYYNFNKKKAGIQKSENITLKDKLMYHVLKLKHELSLLEDEINKIQD